MLATPDTPTSSPTYVALVTHQSSPTHNQPNPNPAPTARTHTRTREGHQSQSDDLKPPPPYPHLGAPQKALRQPPGAPQRVIRTRPTQPPPPEAPPQAPTRETTKHSTIQPSTTKAKKKGRRRRNSAAPSRSSLHQLSRLISTDRLPAAPRHVPEPRTRGTTARQVHTRLSPHHPLIEVPLTELPHRASRPGEREESIGVHSGFLPGRG